MLAEHVLLVYVNLENGFRAISFEMSNTAFTLTQLNQLYLSQFKFQLIKWLDFLD